MNEFAARLRLCMLALVLLVAVCAVGGEANSQGRVSLEAFFKRLGYDSVPLKRDRNNHLVVRGELDGKTRTFTIDTGWSATSVDKSVARKLKKLGERQLEDSFLGTITNGDVVLMNFKLGAAGFTNQPANTRSLAAGGGDMGDCILGCDFLFRNFCVIDCREQRLYFRGAEPPDKVQQTLQESLRHSGFHQVPLTSRPFLMMKVDAKANHQPVQLLLDTGFPWTAFDSSKVKRLHLRKEPTPVKLVGVGKIGEAWLDRGILKSLELGDLSFKNVDVGIADLSGWGVGEPGLAIQDLDGLLGAEILAANRGLIDCHDSKLWLQPQHK
jgi:predicted aspartyl protease